MPQTIQGNTLVGTSGNDDLRTLYYDSATETTTIYSAISGLGGNDRLDNNGLVENVTLDGGADNDRIYNTVNGGGQSPSLVGGAGNDNIQNGYATDQLKANDATIDAGAGADTVDNYGDNALINLGDGNDSLYNVGNKATISAGAGADTVSHFGDDSSIDAGAGDDTVGGYGNNVTVRGGAGNDSITGNGNNDSVDSKILLDDTQGNNSFNIGYSTNSTINAGSGNDTISADYANENLLINAGAGNNSIVSQYGNGVTINAAGGSDTITIYDGSNFVVNAGDGANVIENSRVNDTTASGHTITSGSGNDSITNRVNNALINAGNGDNYVVNGAYGSGGGSNVTINTGSGNDFINNYYDSEHARGAKQENVIINSGAGNDTVTNITDKVTIDGGAGNDEIDSYNSTDVSINGGAGADTIFIANGTVSGGAGDDSISAGNKVLIQYNSGDGSDFIQGFNATTTLSIGGGNYSSVVSGSDVVLTVGDEEIVLSEAASLDNLNIVGNSSSGDTTPADTTPADTTAAAVVADMILHRTEEGYPVIAGLVLNPTTYHGDEPTNYVSKETWSITSTDGLQLEGYHYTPENSNDKWVVIVHGYGHNHKHMYPFTGFYLDNGYNVLMVDQRAAGESEGEFLTMGAAEGKDIALWTQEIARRYPDAKITLFGVSMGAATAMIAASRKDIKNVTSLVEDCGYTNAMELVKTLHSNIQTLQDLLPAELLPALDNAAGSLTGYKLSDADPIGGISKAKMPTLFITGTNDSVVPASMLSSLYDASGAKVKETFIVEGANHGLSGLYDPVGYSNATFRFLAEANGEGWITENVVDDISLSGTKYADTISNSGDNVTINTAAGADQISLSADAQNVLLQYSSGDGNDFIDGFDGDDTLSIAGGNYSSAVSGSDVVLTVGRGKITLSNAADLDKLNIVGGSDTTPPDTTPANEGIYVANSVSHTLITGTAYNDTLYTSAGRVTINGLAGDDLITNDVDSSVTAASAVANLIDAGAGNDTILNYHSYQPTLKGGDGNDYIVVSHGHMTFIDAGNGNDSIIGQSLEGSNWAMGGHATLLGGDGNDYISPGYTNNSTINGGAGNDTIVMMGADSTITGSTGDDRISLGSADSVNVRINYASGDGNDVINGFTENDTLNITGSKYYSVASGNDLILTVGNGHVTLRGAATLEDINIIGSYDEAADNIISNSTNAASVVGTSGNDTITNTGARATIDALGGNDSITSSGSNVLIYGDAGNDTILASGKNSTIDGGTGSNRVSVTGSQGLYVVFDGQTTVDGFNTGFGSGSDTVYIPGTPAAVGFRSGILTFYDDSNSVALSGVTKTAKVNLYHESRQMLNKGVFIAANDWYSVESDDLTVKSGEEVYFVGPSDTSNHGVDFSGISSKLNLTLDTAYIDSEDYVPGTTTWINGVYSIRGGAGNTTITGSGKSDTIFAGTGNTTIDGAGGNDHISLNSARAVVNYWSNDGNDYIAGFNENSTLRVLGNNYDLLTSGGDVIVSVGSGRITLQGAADLEELNIVGTVGGGGEDTIEPNMDVYIGGNDTISSYAGQPILFASDYQGALFNGNNFVVYSSDGTLTIEDITDKVIDLRDADGNEALKAYTASTAGVIDGRGLAGYEIIAGAANGTDIIYSGDGGSMLWGGAGTVADALLGGEGSDTFITGQHQGSDNIFNAGAEDIINLNDATLSDIVSAAEVEGNKIVIGFASGNAIAVNSTDEISATFNLADGSRHTYNHATKTWQSA